jgi:predicted XRE-type DNA-binding protein
MNDLHFFGPERRLLVIMVALVQRFNASGLTQVVAAKTLGVTQPRLNQLLKGKIEIFSLDALVNMATSAGMRVGLMEKVHQALKTQQDVVHLRALAPDYDTVRRDGRCQLS